jgi:hypothetical protein
MVLSWVKSMVRKGFAFAAGFAFCLSVARAETGEVIVFTNLPTPVPLAAESKPSVLRRYEVKADKESGRLVRVRAGRTSQPQASGAGTKASGKKVVQGQLTPAAGRVEISSLVAAAAQRHGVNPALIHAVIRQESNYDWYAVSEKGACGLMQLLPVTARRFGVRNIFDPAENVEGGVKYLRHLLDRYSGDAALTLAAYNAGEGAVERFGGIPPYRETQEYVGRVSRFTGSFHSSVSEGLADDVSEVSSQARVIARTTEAGVIRFEME